MSLKLDIDRVRANVQAASTDDLKDRATFYRAGMEPEALDIIEAELRRRGVGPEELEKWGPQPDEAYLWLHDGTVAPCSYCTRPAVETGWSWHRIWGWLPLFPRIFRYCRQHAGSAENADRDMENTE
jgi:hypothetical protein